jgi:hypothetical protein
VIVADSTEPVPVAVGVAALADSCRDAAMVPRAPSDKAWAEGSVEEAVVVVEVNGLLVSQKQEVVDRSLGAAGVLQEVQSVRWGKQVIQLGEHQQAEANPLDGR